MFRMSSGLYRCFALCVAVVFWMLPTSSFAARTVAQVDAGPAGDELALTYDGPVDSGTLPDVNPTALVYAFTVSGVDLDTLPPDALHQAVSCNAPRNGFAWEGGNTFYVIFRPQDPTGEFVAGFTLRDGRHAEASFVHSLPMDGSSGSGN